MEWKSWLGLGLGALILGLFWWGLGFRVTFVLLWFVWLVSFFLEHNNLRTKFEQAAATLDKLKDQLKKLEADNPNFEWTLPKESKFQMRTMSMEAPARDPDYGPKRLPGVDLKQIEQIFNNDEETEKWLCNEALPEEFKNRECTLWTERNEYRVRQQKFTISCDVPVVGRFDVHGCIYHGIASKPDRLTMVSEYFVTGPPYADAFSIFTILEFQPDGEGVKASQWLTMNKNPEKSLPPFFEGMMQAKGVQLFKDVFDQIMKRLQGKDKFEPNDPDMAEREAVVDMNQRPVFEITMLNTPLERVETEMLRFDWPMKGVVEEFMTTKFSHTYRSTPWTVPENSENRNVRRSEFQVPIEVPRYLRWMVSPPVDSGQIVSWYEFQTFQVNLCQTQTTNHGGVPLLPPGASSDQGFKILHRMQSSDVPFLKHFILEDVIIFERTGARANGTRMKRWFTLIPTVERDWQDYGRRSALQERVRVNIIEASKSLASKLKSAASLPPV